MKPVFADTSYWIAHLIPGDSWAALAKAAGDSLGQQVHIVTTDEVLGELLAALSGVGKANRAAAVATVRKLQRDPNVTVVAQSRETFNAALLRYEQRGDKQYSLTDCASMNAMRERGLTEVLTSDRLSVLKDIDPVATKTGS
ncbi:MAG: PIN domain-containing protein [Planctomycetes bacterium]|nr:PIN domain-containing protein [Planctomycetota bacterium]